MIHLSGLGQAEPCSQYENLAQIYYRLSGKKDKSAATRANARAIADENMRLFNACMAKRSAPAPVASPPPPPPPPPTIIPTVTPITTVTPPLLPPAAQPWIPAVSGAGWTMPTLPGAGGPMLVPIDDISGGMVADFQQSAPGQAIAPYIPGAPAASQAAGDECSLAGSMPLTYSDEYGPMTVLQIVCPEGGASPGAAAPAPSEEAFGASPIGPIEASEIEYVTQDEGMSGLDYIGLARNLDS
jgi:hypothetical protein